MNDDTVHNSEEALGILGNDDAVIAKARQMGHSTPPPVQPQPNRAERRARFKTQVPRAKKLEFLNRSGARVARISPKATRPRSDEA